jgi:hypothetical protein
MKKPNHIVNTHDREISEMTIEELKKMRGGEVCERGINGLAWNLAWTRAKEYLAKHNLTFDGGESAARLRREGPQGGKAHL